MARTTKTPSYAPEIPERKTTRKTASSAKKSPAAKKAEAAQLETEETKASTTENADGSVDIAFTPKRNSDAESTQYTEYKYAVEDFQCKSMFSSDRTSKTGEYDVSDVSLWAA